MGDVVTIKDVARAANVSVATVSRALNGHAHVAESVRSRVLKVADELHYSPHHAARSLSSRRTHTIGVVLPDLHGEFFSELMRGVDQVARVNGMHLLVSSYHGHPDEQGVAVRAMRGRVDGLLLMSPYVGADNRGTRVDLAPSLPTLLINTRPPGSGVGVLSVDNHAGACAMVRHLLEQGHRRIAFIAGPSDNYDASERLRGYLETLSDASPDIEPWVLEGNFDEASGHAAGQEILRAGQRPDAVFAANDMMALGCLFALSQAGVDVPGEVALAGFDDIPLSRYVHPSLTTMRVNIVELGARAMQTLIDTINGEGETQVSLLEPELIERSSTRAQDAVKPGNKIQ